jgi:hypothetical protein
MNCVANASPNNINGQILTSSTTNVQPQTFVSSSGGMAANPFSLVCQKAGSDFNATRTIIGSFTGPQSEIKVVGGSGHGSTNTRIRRFTSTEKSIGSDITNSGDSATLGHSFTINTTGLYSITTCDFDTSTIRWLGVSVNSNQLTTGIASITDTHRVLLTAMNADRPTCAGATLNLIAGDIIRAHTEGSTTGSGSNYVNFRIVKVNN